MEHTLPVIFADRGSWREWLHSHHTSEKEIWVRYFKKSTNKPSVKYDEAVEEALCFGWIDGMIKTMDEETYIQRFTPRKMNSNWSEVNIERALRMEKEGKMHPSGLKFKDRWIPGKGHDIRRHLTETNISSFEEALSAYPEAAAAFENLPPSHRKHYIEFIFSAKKEETKLKRMADSIALLQKGQRLGMK